MLDLVGNPNCWFCHAQAQILGEIEEVVITKLDALIDMLSV